MKQRHMFSLLDQTFTTIHAQIHSDTAPAPKKPCDRERFERGALERGEWQMKSASEMAHQRALVGALLSLKAIAQPEPNSPPDGVVCAKMAQGALRRVADAIPKAMRKGAIAQLLEDLK